MAIISFIFIARLFGASWAVPFLSLQHEVTIRQTPEQGGHASTYYTRGFSDFWFVLYWAMFLTAARAMIMRYILLPWAKAGGIRSPTKRLRFAEQGAAVVYFVFAWTFGAVCCFVQVKLYDLIRFFIIIVNIISIIHTFGLDTLMIIS